MKITWLGHSCFMLETTGGTIVFDPYSDGSVPGWQLGQLTADEVLCSHGHDGHGAVSAVRLRRGGAASPFAAEDMETYHDVMLGRLRGGNTARIISAEGLRIVHLGDLGCPLTAGQTERISGCDALLIPVGGILTIEPYAAYELVRAARPKLVIPMHYNVGGGSRRLRRVEEFTSLFAPDEVEYMDESRLTLTSEDAPRPLVAVLAPPWGER